MSAHALSVQRTSMDGTVLDHGTYCPACAGDGVLLFAAGSDSADALVVRQMTVGIGDDDVRCAGCRVLLATGLGGLASAAGLAAATRTRSRTAMDALADAVRAAVADGMSESEAARRAGVQRMTVRRWLGKPVTRTPG